MRTDPFKDNKEDVLVLTNAFIKFSKAFVINNQKALNIGKVLLTNGCTSIGFHLEFIVIKVVVLRMRFCHTCTPCTTSRSP